MDEVEPASSSVVFNYGLQASTFAVDCLGQKAVLAVQKWLAVVSLETSDSATEHKPLRKLGRSNKYEIKGVLWNPHKAKHGLMASTCQQKLEIWDVAAERHPLLHSIKAHIRPVSDLSWSFNEPGLMASCSTDSFIHVWDTRDTKRPSISFKAVAGATLVQWSRLNGDLIASAHDSDIRIWDRRKPSTASGYITAHTSRIHNLDWSHSSESHLTTCSHDGSVKFWNTTSPREPTDVIKAAAHPLWRAKNYPGGDAVGLLLVPTLHGGDTRVFLWNRTNLTSPTHILSGHSDAVLELQWIDGGRLVTWSRDRTLRIWSINDQLKFNLGGGIGEKSVEVEDQYLPSSSSLAIETSLTNSVTPTATPTASGNSLTDGPSKGSFEEIGNEEISGKFSLGGGIDGGLNPTMSLPLIRTMGPSEATPTGGGSGSPSTHSLASHSSVSSLSSANPVFQSIGSHSLAKEFSQLRTETIPNLEVERLEAAQRNCTVKVYLGSQLVRVGISFPSHYPYGAAPSFMFDQSSMLPMSTQLEIHRNLTEQASALVKQNKPCLEACLHFLVRSLEGVTNRPTPPKKSPDLDLYGRLDDKHIPFPRTSGARFSASGLLVCFNSPSGLTASDNIKTPRSLNKMNTYTSRIHPVVMGGGSRWSGHAYHSTPVAPRTSPGNKSTLEGAFASRGADQGAGGGNPRTSPVTVYNAVPLLPIDLHLAQLYSLSGDSIDEICSQNATLASHRGRADLVKAWSTAALVASDIAMAPPPSPTSMPWPRHPFCRSLIKSLFSHFSHLHDVQMLAMLACVFQEHCKRTSHYMRNRETTPHTDQQQQQQPPPPPKQPSPPDQHHSRVSFSSFQPQAPFSFFTSSNRSSNGIFYSSHSPPKKAPPTSSEHEVYGGSETSTISSSWQEVQMMDGSMPSLSEVEDSVLEEKVYHEKQCRLLDSTMMLQCDEYRRSYCDILYAWSLLEQRTEILKYQVNKSSTRSNNTGIVPCVEARTAGALLMSKYRRFTCSICNLSVKGSSNLCLSCGHGGHTKHLMEWFNKHSLCPTGCGCSCLQASGWS